MKIADLFDLLTISVMSGTILAGDVCDTSMMVSVGDMTMTANVCYMLMYVT